MNISVPLQIQIAHHWVYILCALRIYKYADKAYRTYNSACYIHLWNGGVSVEPLVRSRWCGAVRSRLRSRWCAPKRPSLVYMISASNCQTPYKKLTSIVKAPYIVLINDECYNFRGRSVLFYISVTSVRSQLETSGFGAVLPITNVNIPDMEWKRKKSNVHSVNLLRNNRLV